jgi:hypothetical protein
MDYSATRLQHPGEYNERLLRAWLSSDGPANHQLIENGTETTCPQKKS